MLVTINIVLIKRGKDNANNYKDNVSKKGEIIILILIKRVLIKREKIMLIMIKTMLIKRGK